MSTTITIENNLAYCRAHNLAVERPSYCQCCYPTGDNPEPGCPGCNGTGIDCPIPFVDLPFEMNLANGNFNTLWSALGFTPSQGGSMDARQILRVLASMDTELLLRAEDTATGKKGCQVYYGGICEEQAESYLSRLKEIAEEAAKREELVVWS